MAITIRLPAEVEARLQNLATLSGRSKSFFVTEAVRAHLDDLEDAYLAKCELDAIANGRSIATPLLEVMRRYGAAD